MYMESELEEERAERDVESGRKGWGGEKWGGLNHCWRRTSWRERSTLGLPVCIRTVTSMMSCGVRTGCGVASIREGDGGYVT